MKNNSNKSVIGVQTVLYRHICMIVMAVILFIVLPSNSLQAQGSLLLTPKRIIFEGNKTSESINLANSGTDTARYVISLVDLRMNEDGSFEEISQADAWQISAEPYLRYFPRTVTLAPNEAQVIRVQYNRQAQMAPGEYRSHIYVRALSTPTPLGEKGPEQTASIAVKLQPVFGISIPVIIRVGETNATAFFSGISLETPDSASYALSMVLNRTGNMSIYGNIIVRYITPNGISTVVATVKGLAVYTPNKLRRIQLPLDKNMQIDCRHPGKLVVQFFSHANDKDKKIAETEMVVQ